MRGYELHRVVAHRVTYLGDGSVSGVLLDLGRYPGMVEGPGTVQGEIYRLDDRQLLATLDRVEGYNFERARTVVTFGDGRRAQGWVYRYRGTRERAVPIADGDYRRAHPRRSRRANVGHTEH